MIRYIMFCCWRLLEKITNLHSHWNNLPISMTRASESEPSDNISLESTSDCLGCCLSIWSFSFVFITSGFDDIFRDALSPKMHQRIIYNDSILQDSTHYMIFRLKSLMMSLCTIKCFWASSTRSWIRVTLIMITTRSVPPIFEIVDFTRLFRTFCRLRWLII